MNDPINRMSTSDPAEKINVYWQEYLNSLPAQKAAHYPHMPEAWGFGDSSEMADELGTLVLAGTKTATCSLVWEYEFTHENIPQAAELSIILDGNGDPLCIIETTEITLCPFNQVGAEFAYDEGEEDRSLESWRSAHWHFFNRTCQNIGKSIDEAMPLVCERFRVVWPTPTFSGGNHAKDRL
jgi:uncharacterized protein YhfF